MTIGERIKKRREDLGISQVSLADAISERKQTVYKYENGIVTNIPIDKIELIAKALCTTPSYIMGWDEEIISELKNDLHNQEKPATQTSDELSDEDLEIIKLLRAASPAKRAALLALLKE